MSSAKATARESASATDAPSQKDAKTGRFLPGNSGFGGRPKGARSKLTTEFIDDFYAAWQEQTHKPCPYVHEITDRHVHRRAYFRKREITLPLPVEHYYASRFWTALSSQSRRTYRHILDHFVKEHGHRILRQMEAKHVEAIIAAKGFDASGSNKLRKLLSLLMRALLSSTAIAMTIPSPP